MSDLDDDLDYLPKSNLPPWVLPAATSGLALLVGLGVGALASFLVVRTSPSLVEVPRELTQNELMEACAPFVATAATELDEAQEKVAVLRTEVARKEAQVKDLEEEIARRNERGKAFVAEYNQMKKDLADLREQLVAAEREKEALVIELRRTVEQLEETEEALEQQTELTQIARSDALANKWDSFVNDTQLEICEKGNRKKLGKCRETVVASLNSTMRSRYEHCIRAGQEAPALHALEKDQTMPRFGQYLGEESKVTRDWYVHLCDPTLPEAGDLADLPGLRGSGVTNSSAGFGIGFDLDD